MGDCFSWDDTNLAKRKKVPQITQKKGVKSDLKTVLIALNLKNKNMKKIIVLAVLLIGLVACSNNNYKLSAFFGVKIGTPTSELSDIMELQGFKRSGRWYSYKPKVEHFVFLEKEYHKFELDGNINFAEQEEMVNAISISFKGHKEFKRLSKYLKENIDSTPVTKTDTFTYDVLGTDVVDMFTELSWIQNTDGVYTVLTLRKSTEKMNGQEKLTTLLNLEKLNHL